MRLDGLHHITAITADARANVDFYVRVLGLRLVKKTVNFDAPDVYHLYFGDETGTPGSILTFFEFPGAARGVHGDGMPYRIEWRVEGPTALAFWEKRLRGKGVRVREEGRSLRFEDPEGLEHALVAARVSDAPLVARSPSVPREVALQGFHGVRAYAAAPGRSSVLLEALGFEAAEASSRAWELRGPARHAVWAYDAPAGPGRPGAGTIHHVAWSAADDTELSHFRDRMAAMRAHPTPIIDRQYFHSVYFREPSGVLFELASRDIGFAVDEPAETLGHDLKLPPQHEHLRPQLERTLTPLPDPRAQRASFFSA